MSPYVFDDRAYYLRVETEKAMIRERAARAGTRWVASVKRADGDRPRMGKRLGEYALQCVSNLLETDRLSLQDSVRHSAVGPSVSIVSRGGNEEGTSPKTIYLWEDCCKNRSKANCC